MFRFTIRDVRALFQPTLHLWTCIAIVMTAGALLLENLDGYHNHFGGDYSEEPPTINWAHGWPFPCVVRKSSQGLTPADLKVGFRVVQPGLESYTSRWPFDSALVSHVYPGYVALDFALAVLLLVSVGLSIQLWTTYFRIPNQFGLKTVFVIITLSAVFTFVLIHLARLNTARFIVHYICLMILTIALVVLVSGLSLLMHALRIVANTKSR
jgi:hypothetical protein